MLRGSLPRLQYAHHFFDMFATTDAATCSPATHQFLRERLQLRFCQAPLTAYLKYCTGLMIDGAEVPKASA